MQKSTSLVTAAIIAITAMFIIGILPMHFAKASTCSASTGGTTISSTTSGSCSSSSATSARNGGVLTGAGGGQSSCTGSFSTQHIGISSSSSSNGAISCSSP